MLILIFLLLAYYHFYYYCSPVVSVDSCFDLTILWTWFVIRVGQVNTTFCLTILYIFYLFFTLLLQTRLISQALNEVSIRNEPEPAFSRILLKVCSLVKSDNFSSKVFTLLGSHRNVNVLRAQPAISQQALAYCSPLYVHRWKG